MAGTRRVVDWMPERDLLAAAARGLTYDEIAELNYRKTGDKPTRSGVAKKLLVLGAEPRQIRTGDLMPWRVQMQHYQSRLRYMLNALAQWREKGEESSRDALKKTRELMEILDGSAYNDYPRMRFVVDYDAHDGWCLRPREDTDEDYVRKPKARTMTEHLERTPGLTESQRTELIRLAKVIQKSQRVPKRGRSEISLSNGQGAAKRR